MYNLVLYADSHVSNSTACVPYGISNFIQTAKFSSVVVPLNLELHEKLPITGENSSGKSEYAISAVILLLYEYTHINEMKCNNITE